MIRLPAIFVALAALLAQKTAPPVTLAARIALPHSYVSEQDTESDGTFDFAKAPGVRGHILRRFVQPDDDKMNVTDIAAEIKYCLRDLALPAASARVVEEQSDDSGC